MLRVSHQELVERWAQTYRDDGYTVRAVGVAGFEEPDQVNGVRPDMEAARNGKKRVYVLIIDTPEELMDDCVRKTMQCLAKARGKAHALHLIVAAECMLQLSGVLGEWKVEPDLVHVT